MKYDFNISNFAKLIYSEMVPDDSDGYTFQINEIEVTIKKPYTDRDGDAMGNSIFIKPDDSELIASIRMEANYLFAFYRESDTDSFKTLNEKSPRHIVDFIKNIWEEIINHIEDTESAPQGDVRDLTFDSFKTQFGMYAIPNDLEELFTFERKYGQGTYSESFYLNLINKSGLKTYSEEESFLHSFIEFATATAGGSTYAFWVINENLDKCPIVVFGDEGGIHVVAKSIEQLIHLLTYDVEITVFWENVYFFKNEEYDSQSEHHKAFLQWAKEKFALDPITTDEEADAIIKKASDKYADSLHDHLVKYGIDMDEGYAEVKARRTRVAFEKNFEGREIPQELVLLYDFQQNHSNYAQYFYLQGYDRSILETWNQHQIFSESIIPFARANSFGAVYAFWDSATGKDLNQMPIIVLDEENGIHVVAENILQLMHLLTYDIEPVIDEESFMLYNNKDSFATSNHHEVYLGWLKDNFGIEEAVEEPFEEIIDIAQEKYAEAFWGWQKNLS